MERDVKLVIRSLVNLYIIVLIEFHLLVWCWNNNLEYYVLVNLILKRICLVCSCGTQSCYFNIPRRHRYLFLIGWILGHDNIRGGRRLQSMYIQLGNPKHTSILLEGASTRLPFLSYDPGLKATRPSGEPTLWGPSGEPATGSPLISFTMDIPCLLTTPRMVSVTLQ